jgi:hypothetical protein
MRRVRMQPAALKLTPNPGLHTRFAYHLDAAQPLPLLPLLLRMATTRNCGCPTGEYENEAWLDGERLTAVHPLLPTVAAAAAAAGM